MPPMQYFLGVSTHLHGCSFSWQKTLQDGYLSHAGVLWLASCVSRPLTIVAQGFHVFRQQLYKRLPFQTSQYMAPALLVHHSHLHSAGSQTIEGH
jgi:hypothetical protein